MYVSLKFNTFSTQYDIVRSVDTAREGEHMLSVIRQPNIL